jgi:hypothetical protein
VAKEPKSIRKARFDAYDGAFATPSTRYTHRKLYASSSLACYAASIHAWCIGIIRSLSATTSHTHTDCPEEAVAVSHRWFDGGAVASACHLTKCKMISWVCVETYLIQTSLPHLRGSSKRCRTYATGIQASFLNQPCATLS